MENTPFLYYPVRNPINQTNLFGANAAQYKPLGQAGHPGNDFEAPSYTPIYAPCDGGARYIKDSLGGDGLWIYYTSPDGKFYNVILWHMPVATDTEHWILPTTGISVPVKAGQLIGYTDNSGFPAESTGPHLHLGLMPCDIHGNPLEPNNGYLGCIDPAPFFNGQLAQDISLIPAASEAVQTAKLLVNQVNQSNVPPEQKATFYSEIGTFLEEIKQIIFP